MWLLIFIFGTATILLGWTLFGYFIYMFILGLFNRKNTPVIPDILPSISIIIPCFNEENSIVNKINNLKSLDYPKNKLEILFVDGNSNDKTIELLETYNEFIIHKCPVNGKINQLNYILPKIYSNIVLITDVDGLLKPNTLKWIAAEFNSNPDASVVGAYCYPINTLEIEHYYWSAQNRGRFLETYAKTSSIVVAQCYAFKNGLLTSFPDDVIADDIYTAFLANTLNKKTIYSYHAIAYETRTPKLYSEFIPHKFRKSNAFLRESLRFLYRLPEMNIYFKLILATKIAQQLLLPLGFLIWIILSGVLLTLYRYDIVIIGAAILFFLFVITSRIFASIILPDGIHKYSLLTIIKGYIMTNIIVLATGLCYPFYNQNSNYKRLR